jgi:riboflavin synthase
MTMFTGIVEELGEVIAIEHGIDSARIVVRAPRVTADAANGASIAVNGVCLTVVDLSDGAFTADVMRETLQRSSLGALSVGSPMNLERAVRASDRLGGHIVQGHVDGVGEVASVDEDGFAKRLRVNLGPELVRYAIDKGSIALSGVSLTVAAIGDSWVEVSLIPETLERTNLGEAAVGRKLNVESDLIAKYVERLVSPLAGKEQR